ncbi:MULTISPECIES: hypothetical protein [unclassified Nocardioides]|uniref:hypothetical protein n=1 Tax=unclassified Nocardioides TaxID=2615069 RepID=UPI003611FBC1
MLTVLGLPEALVNQCREILDNHASSMKEASPMQTGAGVFGGSTHGAQMGHHTNVAHQHVVDALNQMAAGLQGYATNLNDFVRDLSERDFEAAAALTPSRRRELLDAGTSLNSHDLHNDGGTD